MAYYHAMCGGNVFGGRCSRCGDCTAIDSPEVAKEKRKIQKDRRASQDRTWVEAHPELAVLRAVIMIAITLFIGFQILISSGGG